MFCTYAYRVDADASDAAEMTSTVTSGHRLTHRTIRDASGERLTPACTCGWWSPDGSHWRFERHIKAVTEDES